MGRGRQKAKHTKVARELKYSVPDTNYGALQRELSGGHEPHESDEMSKWSEYFDDEDDDKYEDVYADQYPDEDDAQQQKRA